MNYQLSNIEMLLGLILTTLLYISKTYVAMWFALAWTIVVVIMTIVAFFVERARDQDRQDNQKTK